MNIFIAHLSFETAVYGSLISVWFSTILVKFIGNFWTVLSSLVWKLWLLTFLKLKFQSYDLLRLKNPKFIGSLYVFWNIPPCSYRRIYNFYSSFVNKFWITSCPQLKFLTYQIYLGHLKFSVIISSTCLNNSDLFSLYLCILQSPSPFEMCNF